MPELSGDVRFSNRFQREPPAAAMLEEPHVIPIYDNQTAVAHGPSRRLANCRRKPDTGSSNSTR